jgi:hypothetical protein
MRRKLNKSSYRKVGDVRRVFVVWESDSFKKPTTVLWILYKYIFEPLSLIEALNSIFSMYVEDQVRVNLTNVASCCKEVTADEWSL